MTTTTDRSAAIARLDDLLDRELRGGAAKIKADILARLAHAEDFDATVDDAMGAIVNLRLELSWPSMADLDAPITATEIADEADRKAGYGPDPWLEALDRPLPDRALLEAYVRDPDEAYAIFRDACHDRGLSGERVIVEMLDKLMLRVAVLEEACAGQIRDHEIRQTIAEHRAPNGAS